MPVLGFPLGVPLDLGLTAPPLLPQDDAPVLSLVYRDAVLSALVQADTGTDVSLISSLNGSWPVLGGDPILAEQTIRRLTTPRGTLDFSPNDGIDIRDALRDDLDQDGVFQAKQRVENELLKDERLDDVDTVAAYDADAKALQLSITLYKATGAFKLVLSVTALTVDILSAEAV